MYSWTLRIGLSSGFILVDQVAPMEQVYDFVLCYRQDALPGHLHDYMVPHPKCRQVLPPDGESLMFQLQTDTRLQDVYYRCSGRKSAGVWQSNILKHKKVNIT